MESQPKQANKNSIKIKISNEKIENTAYNTKLEDIDDTCKTRRCKNSTICKILQKNLQIFQYKFILFIQKYYNSIRIKKVNPSKLDKEDNIKSDIANSSNAQMKENVKINKVKNHCSNQIIETNNLIILWKNINNIATIDSYMIQGFNISIKKSIIMSLERVNQMELLLNEMLIKSINKSKNFLQN